MKTISPSLHEKLTTMRARYQQLGLLLSSAEVIQNQNDYQRYAKERAQLEPIVHYFEQYQTCDTSINDTQALLQESDAEMKVLAEEELSALETQKATIIATLQKQLIPQDPNDTRNIFLEIRAGTGGDEAALFAGDLLRMYTRFGELRRWKLIVVGTNEGEHGGFKEVIARVEGKNVYGALKFESGAHRVQRVPSTESQGRIHTSACTVAVLPEADEIDDIELNPADLRTDTFRASGAGGQHVNKTDSAVRLTHLPTGIVVECQDDRSQHKNRARAMGLLRAKILDSAQQKQEKERAQTRRNLVGSGDRSERIRTYNFPQGRITDHRIQLTLYNLSEVMEGALEHIITPLIQAHETDQLTSME